MQFCRFLSRDLKYLKEVCRCLQDMAWPEYNKLREKYKAVKKDDSRQNFWKFVDKNYISRN